MEVKGRRSSLRVMKFPENNVLTIYISFSTVSINAFRQRFRKAVITHIHFIFLHGCSGSNQILKNDI